MQPTHPHDMAERLFPASQAPVAKPATPAWQPPGSLMTGDQTAPPASPTLAQKLFKDQT